MKRYKPKMFIENPVTKKVSIFEDYRCKHPYLGEDHIRVTMSEDPQGEWVKWEDIRSLVAKYMNPFELAGFIESLTEEHMKDEGRI